MALRDILVPDIGDSESVEVIEVCVNNGDNIAVEDPMIVLESDKATIEVPAPEAGEVAELKVKVGDKVSEGDLVLLLKEDGNAGASSEAASAAPSPEPQPEPAEPETASVASAPSEPAPVSGTQEVVLKVPDIGGDDAVDVIEIAVAVGDAIQVDDTLIVMESDKATMEIPATHAGTVKQILVKEGDKLSEGADILVVEAEVAAATAGSAEAAPAQAESQPITPAAPSASETPVPAKPADISSSAMTAQGALSANISSSVHAGPAVRRLANELGADLSQVKGSGPKGRILKDDVHAFVKQQMLRPKGQPSSGMGLPELPKVDFAKFGEIEAVELTKIQRVSAQNLHRSWLTIPHVTQFDEADITEMESFRKEQSAELKEQGIKLTPLAFLVKACAYTLNQFPKFKSSLDPHGDALIMKKYCHIGIAVDTPNGLVVPVIRDADKKSVIQIAEEMKVLSEKARNKKLSPADMSGGCFSISSLGGIGGTAFTPIVNWPEVSILGVSRSQMKPVYQNGEFVPRLMLPLSLSYDHRVIDGADAARFTSYLASVLSDIRKLLL